MLTIDVGKGAYTRALLATKEKTIVALTKFLK